MNWPTLITVNSSATTASQASSGRCRTTTTATVRWIAGVRMASTT